VAERSVETLELVGATDQSCAADGPGHACSACLVDAGVGVSGFRNRTQRQAGVLQWAPGVASLRSMPLATRRRQGSDTSSEPRCGVSRPPGIAVLARGGAWLVGWRGASIAACRGSSHHATAGVRSRS
jgi:hypothetical protein